MKNKKSTGILTWHYYSNFGSALQAFALQRAVENLGHEATIVNYHHPKFGRPSRTMDSLRFLLAATIGRIPADATERFRYPAIRFSHEYHHLGRLTTDESILPRLTRHYDVLICGSDQIWAPNVFNPVYFAAFAEKNVCKVSYAASIGLNALPKHLVPRYRELLRSFHAIGIREEEGRKLLKKDCGIDSTVVLDPTLLLDASVYRKMRRRVRGIRGPFLFCYFLNKEHKYRESVQRYAHENGLRIVGVSDRTDDGEWMHRLTDLGADHFLWLIDNAEAVMTDSCHGSIFSLLFHKDLWIFQRFAEDDPICQNSRIRQLRTNFDIGHRIISAASWIEKDGGIDYGQFESRLGELRASSLDFLRHALE